MFFLFILIGFLIGFLVGLSGIGGGVLTTPLLLLLGVDPLIVVGTDLLFATVTKLFASYLYKKSSNINFEILKILIFGSIPAIILGNIIFQVFNIEKIKNMIIILVCLILLVTSILNLIKKRVTQTVKDINKFKLFLTSFFVSLIVLFTSVGSGILITYFLMNYSNLRSKEIVGTSVVYGVMISLLSSVNYFLVQKIDFNLCFYLLIGSIPGVIFGYKYHNKIKNIRKILSYLIIVFSIILLIKTLFY